MIDYKVCSLKCNFLLYNIKFIKDGRSPEGKDDAIDV